MVVGREETDAGEIALVLNRQLAEGGEGVELNTGIFQSAGEAWIFKKNMHRFQGGSAVDRPGGVRENPLFLHRRLAILKGYQVAPESGVSRAHDDSGSGGLHRGTPGKIPSGITAENGQNCRFTSRRKGRGAVDGAPYHAFGSHAVDGRCRSGLQRRFIPQLGNGIIGHAVPDDKQIFR